MVAPVVGHGICAFCGGPVDHRKGLDPTVSCSKSCQVRLWKCAHPAVNREIQNRYRRRKRLRRSLYKLATAALEIRQEE